MRNFDKLITASALMLNASLALAQPPADSARLDDVAERGRHVMPFDLETTLHIFDKTEHGGIQQVVAKDAGDNEQIGLIRQHLSELVKRFKQGDFSRQRRIHGDDMPGIAELAESYQRIRFVYKDLPNGAEIEYAAEDPGLIDAVHRYFSAQLKDHARHAVSGAQHGGHESHHQKGHAAPISNISKE